MDTPARLELGGRDCRSQPVMTQDDLVNGRVLEAAKEAMREGGVWVDGHSGRRGMGH